MTVLCSFVFDSALKCFLNKDKPPLHLLMKKSLNYVILQYFLRKSLWVYHYVLVKHL